IISTPTTHIFIGAHPDDIELFSAQQLINSISKDTTNKKVLIVLTAGDAGRGNREPIRGGTPYRLARQQAHYDAISFLNKNNSPLSEGKIKLHNRILYKQQLGDYIVMYNLNLPDGKVNGSGYPTTGSESLAKLWNNET